MIDSGEDIEDQFENQMQQDKTFTHNEQLNNVLTGNNTSDTQQEGTQHNTRNNNNQRKITVNNGQKNRVSNMPLHSTVKEPNEKK